MYLLYLCTYHFHYVSLSTLPLISPSTTTTTTTTMFSDLDKISEEKVDKVGR